MTSMELPPLPSERVLRSIAVDYNEQEYTEFNLVIFRERLRASVLILGIGGIALVGIGLLVPKHTLVWVGIPFVSLGILFVLAAAIQRDSVRNMVKKMFKSPSHWLLIKRAYTLDDAGVKTEGHDGSYSFTPWSSVVDLREGKLAIYFVLNSNMGIIVPRRAFPSDQDGHEFIQFAKLHLVSKEKPVSS